MGDVGGRIEFVHGADMSKSGFLGLTAAAALAAGASSAQAATTLQLGPSDTCAKAGCFGGETRTFKQTFSAAQAAAAGPVSISKLSLFRGIVGDMQDYSVRVSFELPDGTKLGTWGAFTIAVLNGEFVTLGGQAFNWDASMGDLVLKLELLKPGKGGGLGGGGGFGGGFAGFSGPDVVLSNDAPTGIGDIDVNQAAIALPPRLAAIPEPATWGLMILGFGGAGGMLRRKRPQSSTCG
jgi:hypothetical protein